MNRFLPAIVFAVTTSIGLGMTSVVYRSTDMSSATRFERIADEAADRVRLRVEQHISLLRATNAFFQANSGVVDRTAFRTFVSQLDTDGIYDGIQGIGFARLVKTGQEIVAEDQIERGYGMQRKVWPHTGEPVRAPIVLLEPEDERNRAALAYDMFSETIRRNAMESAIRTGSPTASAPVELVQEITTEKQVGFLVYLHFGGGLGIGGNSGTASPVSGFVYAPFRAGDLHNAALSRSPLLPVVLESYDVSGDADVALYRTPGYDGLRAPNSKEVEVEVDIAGRKWKFVVAPSRHSRHSTDQYIAPLLAVLTILLAGALAATTRAQLRAIATARQLNQVNAVELQQKELMLQEMKHRIKNSIARIMAIARQTVNSSDSLEAFDESFAARMQAMASAQDLLTRSHWERAELRELLVMELEQVFGSEFDTSFVKGPAVNVNEKAAQAFGLTFHELATNALKYGEVGNGGEPIRVSWRFGREKGMRILVISWKEPGSGYDAEPGSGGFGTRLMTASIAGELGGRIERNSVSGELEIRITVPAKSIQ